MATDGPTPAPCDLEIFKDGTSVFMTHSIPSNAMEGWVRMVAQLSGQRVDWSFSGGRAVVRALGDIVRVEQAIRDLLPEHDALYKSAVSVYGMDEPPRYFFREHGE